MNQFYVKDGLLNVENGIIQFKKLDHSKTYVLEAFLFWIVFFYFNFTNGKSNAESKFFMFIIAFYWSFPILIQFVKKIFFTSWKRKYTAADIKEIVVMDGENILEEKMIIRLKPSRSKTYIFRKHENQSEPFLHQLLIHEPHLIISR